MKKIAIYLILIFSCTAGISQNVFNRIVEDTIGHVMNSVIVVDTGYIFASGTGNEYGVRSFALTYVDELGEKQWKKVIGDIQSQFWEGWYGNFKESVTGSYISGSIVNPVDQKRGIHINTFDSVFNVEVQNIVMYDTIDKRVYYSILSNDNFFYMTGIIYCSDIEQNKMILVKSDGLGNYLWHKTFGINLYELGSYIIEASNGNILTGGDTWVTHSNNTRWYLLETDTAGNIIWERTFGRSNYNNGHVQGIIETADSNYLACGSYPVARYGGGGGEYLWESSSSTAIISDIESANPTVVIDEITTFTVSGWSEFDCKSFTTITVNALENPTPILLVENNPVCIDDDLIIDLLNEDFNTYAWAGPNGYTNTTPDVLINNVTEANAGTYTVTVEYSNGCTNSAEVNIETHSFVAHAGNHSHCVGDELVLFARPSGLVSYHWEGPNGYNATYDVYEHHIPNASLDMSGTYYVTITDQYGCTASSQTTVIINENPIVNLGDDIQICYSQSIQLGANLTISGGTPTYSYEWAPNDEQLSDHQVANPIATPLSTTLYTLTVSDLHSCSGTDEILITVDQIVDLSASYNAPVCQYDELQLFAQPDGLGYSWQGPYGFTSTEQNPIVTTSANLYNSGTYTLTATNLNECSSSVNIEVEINPLPAVFTGPDQIICEGTNLTLEGGIDELAEYHWTGPNGFESFEQNPTVSSTATTNMQGIYTLVASNEFGCTASASTSINILPIPQSASFDLPPCIYINNPYQFINLGNNDASFDYTWNFGDGIVSNEAAPVYDFQNEGYHC